MHQGAGRSRKRSPPEADEHLSEVVLHPNFKKDQMRIPLAGQRSHWALDGVLKPLLNNADGILQ